MFRFDNVNKVIEMKELYDVTKIENLKNDEIISILEACTTFGMSDNLTNIVKGLMSVAGITKDHENNTVVVNALCFFNGPMKGIGVLLNERSFMIKELDTSSNPSTVSDYIAGGVIRRNRDIDTYNKQRQFHTDDIECIIPVNNKGLLEYMSSPQYILNLLTRVEWVDINVNIDVPDSEDLD